MFETSAQREMSHTMVDSINDYFFKTAYSIEAYATIKKEIIELRDIIRTKIKKLHSLDVYLGNPCIKHEDMNNFIKNNPSAYMVWDEELCLLTTDQSVSFHCIRNKIGGYNDDIVYVTMPVYSFKVSFLMNGCMKIASTRHENFLKKDTLSDIIRSIDNGTYGHPNAISSKSKEGGLYNFTSVCSGNNTFISDYRHFIRNPSPAEWLAILNRIMTWLTTANLHDMYGTPLWRTVYLSDWYFSREAREFSERFFSLMQEKHRTKSFSREHMLKEVDTVLDTVPKFMYEDIKGFIYDSVDSEQIELILFHYAYALWLCTHPITISDDRDSLVKAVHTDIACFHAMSRGYIYCHKEEWFRMRGRIYGAPAEMKLYKQYSTWWGERMDSIFSIIE